MPSPLSISVSVAPYVCDSIGRPSIVHLSLFCLRTIRTKPLGIIIGYGLRGLVCTHDIAVSPMVPGLVATIPPTENALGTDLFHSAGSASGGFSFESKK